MSILLQTSYIDNNHNNDNVRYNVDTGYDHAAPLTAGQETEKGLIRTAIFLNNMFPQINDYLPHTAPTVLSNSIIVSRSSTKQININTSTY